MSYNNYMYKTKKVKLKKEDLIFNEKNFMKENPQLYHNSSMYKTPKAYVPQQILDELEANKSKIQELNEEIEELKKEIELLRSLNEEC